MNEWMSNVVVVACWVWEIIFMVFFAELILLLVLVAENKLLCEVYYCAANHCAIKITAQQMTAS